MIVQDNNFAAALVNQIIGAIIAAAIGSGVTVIGFREKLMRLSDRVDRVVADQMQAASVAANALLDVRRDFQTLCDSLSTRASDARNADRELFERLFHETQRELRQSERRQRYVMDVITAIAAKNGIHHRLSDILLGSHESEEGS